MTGPLPIRPSVRTWLGLRILGKSLLTQTLPDQLYQYWSDNAPINDPIAPYTDVYLDYPQTAITFGRMYQYSLADMCRYRSRFQFNFANLDTNRQNNQFVLLDWVDGNATPNTVLESISTYLAAAPAGNAYLSFIQATRGIYTMRMRFKSMNIASKNTFLTFDRTYSLRHILGYGKKVALERTIAPPVAPTGLPGEQYYGYITHTGADPAFFAPPTKLYAHHVVIWWNHTINDPAASTWPTDAIAQPSTDSSLQWYTKFYVPLSYNNIPI